jgi:SAM-dependent methyltransferase
LIPPDKSEQRRQVLALWTAGQTERALAAAWQGYDADPTDRSGKILLARMLAAHPHLATRARELHRLLNDPDIDPSAIAPAGWSLLLRGGNFFRPDVAATAARLEESSFARDLLKATYVAMLEAELALTRVRRWLLLSQRWSGFPLLVEALIAQAALNCGAWLFDDEERAALDGDGVMVAAYRPPTIGTGQARAIENAIARAVAEQYEGWPYPVWTRVMAEPVPLHDVMRAIDPEGPELPPHPDILIAGCGTGHEAALIALQCPTAKITAIDISAASLRYAAIRCEEIRNIEFRQMDLHRAFELERKFDIVVSSGVLHHLPDPEKGWAALVDVLKPGGMMKVMLYSKAARADVHVARETIADLLDAPVTDDLLRAVRRRLIETRQFPKSRDFFTLPGVHDLLLHRHEETFDVPRIERALQLLGLELAQFCFSDPRNEVAYAREHSHDPLRRDFAAWAALEARKPAVFGGMLEFWCRRPASGRVTSRME